MNRIQAPPGRLASILILTATACFGLPPRAGAQSVQHLSVPQTGGIPGRPVMTGITQQSNSVTVTWDGPSGYYQLFEKLNLSDPNWHPVGGPTNLSRRATLTGVSTNALYRILGPAPQYIGSQACAECHTAIHDNQMNTMHAQALVVLTQVNQQTNPACLPCHTVGYGLPTGFVSATATPQLGGVQCENCHGPAGNHAANPDDPTRVPRLEVAATVCGGCHTGAHQPTYDEWTTSAHSTMVEDMNPASRISACGRCHSSSVRLSLLNNTPLPTGDANVPIGCVTCHNPHQVTANPAQLRNPVSSTNDYFLTTSDVFTNKYNPNINACAQCHNHRGASWTDSSRPPHHSPQYNMLLGTVGLLPSGLAPNQPASHALLIADQCAGCHMQTEPYVSGTQPAVTGHSFSVQTYQVCLQCHPLPEQLVEFTSSTVSNQIAQVKASLDLWATTKAPLALRSNYGARSWEYTTPGNSPPRVRDPARRNRRPTTYRSTSRRPVSICTWCSTTAATASTTARLRSLCWMPPRTGCSRS